MARARRVAVVLRSSADPYPVSGGSSIRITETGGNTRITEAGDRRITES